MGKPQPLEFPKDRRPGDLYLDRVEAEQAEIRRAKREGRKPDLENPPHHAGSQVKVLPDEDENKFVPGHWLSKGKHAVPDSAAKTEDKKDSKGPNL